MQSPNPTASSTRRMILLGALVVAVFIASFLIGRALITNRQPTTANVPEIPLGAALVNPPITLSDFTLTDTQNQPISLSDLRGKPSLVFFGYTNCPDVCPTTMAEYKEVKRLLGSDARDVNFVFVSVDGERDTPERMREWLGLFDAAFIGMTGTPEQLEPLGQKFGLLYERVTLENSGTTPTPGEDRSGHAEGSSAGNYFVNHTSPSFVVDADGVLRLLYFYGTEAQLIADGLRQMLRS